MTSSYTVALHGDVWVIHCSGPVIAGECDALRAAAQAAIDRTGKVVLDLADAVYMDSTGLGLLASLCMSARRRSGDVKLAGPNVQMREILEITMLGRIFEICPTAQDAEAAFMSGTDSASEHLNSTG